MAPERDSSAEERAVLATEDAYVAAEVHGDEAALRRFVDEQFVFNHSDGTTTGREALIRTVLDSRMTGQTVRERTVQFVGDVALVFGTADLRFAGAAPGEEGVSSLRYTSVYVEREGQWRLLALQMQARASG